MTGLGELAALLRGAPEVTAGEGFAVLRRVSSGPGFAYWWLMAEAESAIPQADGVVGEYLRLLGVDRDGVQDAAAVLREWLELVGPEASDPHVRDAIAAAAVGLGHPIPCLVHALRTVLADEAAGLYAGPEGPAVVAALESRWGCSPSGDIAGLGEPAAYLLGWEWWDRVRKDPARFAGDDTIARLLDENVALRARDFERHGPSSLQRGYPPTEFGW